MSFWGDEYRRKAASEDEMVQSGRSERFRPRAFMYVVRQMLTLMNLARDSDLLDVGCANGLLDVVLSGCCRSVLAVEPVPELAALAARNVEACGNVRVCEGHAAAIPAPGGRFDRILVLEVLQLVSACDLDAVFEELRRVARPGARLVFGSVPDAARREAALGPYLEGVRAAGHLTSAEKAAIITRNETATWYEASELIAWWTARGASAARVPPSPVATGVDDRFHLVVDV